MKLVVKIPVDPDLLCVRLGDVKTKQVLSLVLFFRRRRRRLVALFVLRPLRLEDCVVFPARLLLL